MLCEKNIKNSKDSLFYFSIMWRALLIKFLNNELKSLTTSHRFLDFKRNQIMDIETGSKNKITIWGIGYLIWRLGIDLFKREFAYCFVQVWVS